MDDKGILNVRNWSFSLYLLGAMVILIVIVVGLVSVNDYNNTKNMFDRNSQHLQRQTEQDIIATIRLTDESYTLYDSSLNEQMRRGFDIVLTEYQRSGGIPSDMNLPGVKHTLGDQYDIYVINASGVIEYTTYEPELGLDFKTIPYFFTYLTTIRNSEGFFPDRIVEEQHGSGSLRKFAYMPTPDHHYVLELGFFNPSFSRERTSIQYKKAIDRIASANPYIERVRIFNSRGDLVDNTSNEVEVPTRITLENVLHQRADILVKKPETGQSVKYLFIELKNEQYGSDLSRIVEITYNDAMFEKNAGEHGQFHLFIAIFALIIGGCAAFFLSRYLSKPIAGIVRDVDRISAGDLDWKISPNHVAEFQGLELSINAMVISLKTALSNVKDEKAFQQEMINHLPVAVFVKNSDDGKYIFWNTTTEQMFDRVAVDVIGRTAREVFPESMATVIETEDLAALNSQIHTRNKKISNKHPEERIIHVVKVLISDSSGNPRYILGMAVDLTEQTANLKQELLFSITRSDILDQLSIIMNYLERAQLKTTEDAMQAFFDNTIGSVESIRNQIGFIRTLQDLGIVSPKWQQASQSFENALKLLPVHHIDIRAEIGDFELFADPLLPRVFYNLLENSLKHGGRQLTEIRFIIRPSGDSLHLIYMDNGIGIPLGHKQQIFEFRQGSGAGMGLFLVREILGFTGFTITEMGDPGKGVRFEIIVPKGKFRLNR
ncbi:MAG: PAS domain-containing protein [Methanoregula sp.]|nr:PAS domain-containing protein [Methanoregula sp.]